MKHNGKIDCEITDWSKIKYVVRCTWGVHVDHKYPDPVIKDLYFEQFADTEKFVEDYLIEATDSSRIIHIMEVCRFFQPEVYEVTKKVRLK